MNESSNGTMDYILALLPLVPSFVAFHGIEDQYANRVLIAALIIGCCGYWITCSLVPVVAEYTKKCGLGGKDLGKKGTPSEDIVM